MKTDTALFKQLVTSVSSKGWAMKINKVSQWLFVHGQAWRKHNR